MISISYRDALALQQALVRNKIDSKSQVPSPDLLVLLQHQPVYTAGRRATDNAWLEQETSRLSRANPGAEFVSTLRGGETTFHGPGQLVGYPILDIGMMGISTRRYVDQLLKVISEILTHPALPMPIRTLNPCDDPNLPVGTFVGDVGKKIASIGIQVRRRVTSHGFALNVERKCEAGFQHIVPCGLSNTRLISIESALADLAGEKTAPAPTRAVRVLDMVPATVETFGKRFGRKMCEIGDTTEQGLDPTTLRLLRDFKPASQTG
ncbi:uncharacterized protein MELLADRAFT_109757 [Melampsora larici-populina 98AG31]|uniref:lipoyl(octanoyl) transferase n=1 Tax=Melampsora larici-populina (strain 98AG31 / pathotype 3-4-7) TaxID=747676 RepID=F4RXI0_MELLP|nr:uncharacterized protein MELLADRAFT_109757 [Melampsora larici-populina 98AG31]EGG02982.1 hypothetical protein MELLADRAFT_109757 [Melampsora larici-populina 98AG31]